MNVLGNSSLLITPVFDTQAYDVPSDLRIKYKFDINGVAGTYEDTPAGSTRVGDYSLRYVVPATGVSTVVITAKYYYEDGTAVSDTDGLDLPTVSETIDVIGY